MGLLTKTVGNPFSFLGLQTLQKVLAATSILV
jgi:hypothetical protein